MSVTVELTYDMSKAYGARRIEVGAAATVKDALTAVQAAFEERGQSLAPLSRVTAIAVNGILMNHRKGMKTPLRDGDRVAFVKAASGG
jgi:molybdopterin converting factor small subunit